MSTPAATPRRRSRGIVTASAVALTIATGLLALGLSGTLARALPCGAPGSAPCLRVLFVGNSYTFANDLPGTFAQLAGAGGHRVETGMVAPGGASLADHAGSPETLRTISGKGWQYVVLQDQSQMPALPATREREMYPAARSLAATIRGAGASPLFYETFAHRDGWPENGLDYAGMQAQLDTAYETIAGELGAGIALVGRAWQAARARYPGLELWQGDGSHPSEAGTYLTACVFYATFFTESPQGLSFVAGLRADSARELQEIAAQSVLGVRSGLVPGRARESWPGGAAGGARNLA